MSAIRLPGDPDVDEALALEHGLTPDEYGSICEQLGRTPSYSELGMFSVMWSEHCSYKSSRVHLKTFPTDGPSVLQGPGENAGVVDIGDGLAVCFKMESHNHPSFIEPYQGAATGVGGILRDIFTMGARPVANLNSLRFGAPDHPKTRFLVEGVVGGIGGYGNCMGVPTVGGEVTFHPSYNGNILVNAMNVGLIASDGIFLGKATGIGNPVIYVGSRTGRDGIHGATMASGEFDEESEEKRPTVQVGDPFTEKLLLEACLEVMKTGAVVGIQDMGAAGLTCSTVEMADRAGTGIVLDLDSVPRRETGMTPYELLLSESQERMLLVAEKGREQEVLDVYRKWDLQAVVVGEVVDGDRVIVKAEGEVVVDVPVKPLAEGAPIYDRPRERPAALDAMQAMDLSAFASPGSPGETLLALVGSPNLCSRAWVWGQYDHSVQTNTLRTPGGDAAVVRVKGTGKALAITSDVNPRLVALDPEEGGAQAVAEAARNLACVGARPIGTTDCLNFGNPEKPGVMWQFERAVHGIGRACRAFEAPVISGNVSLYNETEGEGILPTPTIGMVGLVDDASRVGRAGFASGGHRILLVGGPAKGSLAGSEWLHHFHGALGGTIPPCDLELELRLGDFLREGIAAGTVASAHDLGEGGLAVGLAECCVLGGTPLDGTVVEGAEPGIGARIDAEDDDGTDEVLFGEGPGRVLVSCAPDALDGLVDRARAADLPVRVLGTVGGDRLTWAGVLDVAVADLAAAHRGGFVAAVGL